MKIAVPSRNNRVDDHFGHCEYFTIFQTEATGMIISEDILSAPEGCGCKSNIAETLADMGVEVLLAGNMGQGAVNVLKNKGIRVVRGCSGNLREAVSNFLAGGISDSDISCVEHGSCNR